MRESQIEKYFVSKALELGGLVRKVAWPGRKGAPDRVVLFEGGIAVFVELKAPDEDPRSSQLREHERLRRKGFRVDVLDTFDAIDRWGWQVEAMLP